MENFSSLLLTRVEMFENRKTEKRHNRGFIMCTLSDSVGVGEASSTCGRTEKFARNFVRKA